MPTVNTVSGPIDTADLGFTLMHEHIIVHSPGVKENFPIFDREAEIEKAADKLKDVQTRGVKTMVDLTPGDWRDIPFVKEVVKRSGMQVVVATGIYWEVPHYFSAESGRSIEFIADLFARDITEGIMDTGVKAAIIKCATDEPGVTPNVERILRAAAKAHRATGVPISTHTHPASGVGINQQDVFESEGVDLSRVVIGHSGDTEDTGYLKKICDRGSFIGMDRFGIDIYPADAPARRHHQEDVRHGLRRADGPLPRRLLPLRLGRPEPHPEDRPQLALQPHPRRRHPRPPRSRRHRRPDHHHDRRQPAPHLRAPRSVLTVTTESVHPEVPKDAIPWPAKPEVSKAERDGGKKPAVRKNPRKVFGDLGERLAEQHLLAKGYRILERNHRTQFGEIDIVALADDTVICVEVRCRRGTSMGYAHESLTPAKQRRMAEMSEAYGLDDETLPPGRRIDLIALDFAADGRLLALVHHENIVTGDL